MCLVLRSGIRDFKFAQKPVRCYKILKVEDGQLKAPVATFTYQVGKTYECPLNNEVSEFTWGQYIGRRYIFPRIDQYHKCYHIPNQEKQFLVVEKYSIGQGFHSFKHLDACLYFLESRKAWECKSGYVVAECTIPKYSGYYEGHQSIMFKNYDGYASDTFRIDRILDKETLDKLMVVHDEYHNLNKEDKQRLYELCLDDMEEEDGKIQAFKRYLSVKISEKKENDK